MLTKKQFRMLELLNEMVLDCQDCHLWTGGTCPIYFTKNSKYLIVGDVPGNHEIVSKEPFVGRSGNILWNCMEKVSFKKEDFIIINSVCCRPINTYGNSGKPAFDDIIECNQWLKKVIKVVKPKNILCLGRYAMWSLLRKTGILNMAGSSNYFPDFDITVTYSVDPKDALYLEPQTVLYKGKKFLINNIMEFKKQVEKNENM